MSTIRSAMTTSGDYLPGQIDLRLADECAKYHSDPYGWVMMSFDWGHGELEGFEGPDRWQKEILIDIGVGCVAGGFDGVVPVDPLRYAVASGHG